MNTIEAKNHSLEAKMKFGGKFQYEHYRNGKPIETWEDPNLAPEAARNHILDVILNGVTAINPWYIGLYSNAYTPQTDDLYSHIGTRFTEIEDYSETTRREYTPDGLADAGIVTNEAARALFTFTANITVNGGFFVSNNTKGDSAAAGAIMLAASQHTPARPMIIGDELLVRYVYTATSA